jgi:hypothetical protein
MSRRSILQSIVNGSKMVNARIGNTTRQESFEMTISPRIDLTLIFERDDVREAISQHCGTGHAPEYMQECRACLMLIALVGSAIVEWRDICELEGAADRLRASPILDSLPKRDAQELVESLRVRAHYLTGETWELHATRDMMLEAADMLEKLRNS